MNILSLIYSMAGTSRQEETEQEVEQVMPFIYVGGADE